MNLFNWFHREKPPSQSNLPTGVSEPLDIDQVRTLLFEAAVSGDEGRLNELCRQHRDTLVKNARLLLQVPEEFRNNPAAIHWYGSGLLAISRYCAQELGEAELLRQVNESELAEGWMAMGAGPQH